MQTLHSGIPFRPGESDRRKGEIVGPSESGHQWPICYNA